MIRKPSVAAKSTAAAAQKELEREKWVKVSWMQHTNLSQTSHICLMIRSAAVNFGRILFASEEESQEWSVRVSIYGLDGLSLLPISCATVGSPVRRINPSSQPFVSYATHDCRWDYLVNLPVRWRDLPRDAYLLFEVMGMDESVVYRATMPFFSRYGKLATGLQRIELQTKPLDTKRNYGLVDMDEEESKESTDDPVWKAIKDLNSIQEGEAIMRSAGPRARRTFGQPQCVPWLDSLTKQQAINVVKDHMKEADVSELGCESIVLLIQPVYTSCRYRRACYLTRLHLF
jgi:Phosphoinositide 3-kinase C2